ncbi:putative disease resistance protein RGA3 [Manihot esculenta]|uniref:putative disease resistance protein RGA3 n=1 Tax=Manihot esculenta TaxID=3983 RepID=UPI000B5D14BD|nr:putative disease resistance protein RGA3 [Manihot esculenta]
MAMKHYYKLDFSIFELQKIKENLEVIKPVLLDAEQQLSQNPWVEIWLENLKQVLYDAEDVVDDFEYEALRRKVTRKVRRFFSSPNPLAFHFKTGHKVKKIRERIDKIAALKSKFGLTERIFHRHVIHKKREMTHSFIDASNVIGREEAKFTIIEMLLQFVDGENVISIIPIVGVGDVLELDKVIIEILKYACLGQKYVDMDIDQPQRTLRETLNGRKYLMILDNDYELIDIDLVYLWMANGLVQSSNENQEFEDVGLRYFEVLCSRCFFLDFSEYGGNVRCKMHELIHDLALSITQNEYSMFIGSTQQFAKSLRHVSFPYPESLSKVVPKSLQNLDCMRTICCINERGDGISSEVFSRTCFSRFQYLRVYHQKTT